MRFLFAALLALACLPALARDYGQWDGADPFIASWFKSLMQPDNPTVPCCGEADAYWADEYVAHGDQYLVTITDDRPDGPLRRPHIPAGTQILVPNSKVQWKHGNPTGHSILFISASAQSVYCFVPGGGV